MEKDIQQVDITLKEPQIKHDFVLGPVDTDSVSFSKKDGSSFTEEEQQTLLCEINGFLPELITYAHDGYYKTALVIKAKNYVLETPEGKRSMKGSALKATTKAEALKEFIKEIIECLMNEGKEEQVKVIYTKYIKEVMDLKDISRWCSRKTVTEKILNPERTTEQKISAALENEEIQEGDKIYTFFTLEKTLCLRDNWNNNHDPYKLMENIWKTLDVFSTVLDMEQFPKYHLKTKRKLLLDIT